MTRDELLKMHEDTCLASREIMARKNHDYTAGGSPFANFEGSRYLGIDPVLGILLRVQDKMKRIETFVRQGTLAVKGESVDDAISDIINYMVLAKGIIRSQILANEPNKVVSKSSPKFDPNGTTSKAPVPTDLASLITNNGGMDAPSAEPPIKWRRLGPFSIDRHKALAEFTPAPLDDPCCDESYPRTGD